MIQLKDGAKIEVVDPNSLELMSDQEILSLVDLQMMGSQDRQLSLLLDKQQAENLSAVELMSLNSLMAVYQEGLVYKANALKEAVKRKLMDPLSE